MKKNPLMKSLLAGSLVLVFTTVMACSSSGSGHSSSEKTNTHEMAGGAGPEFKDTKAKTVFSHYIHVKNALINADVKEASSGAAALKAALTAAGNSKGAELAGKIAAATSITAQRAQLDALTSEVEKVIKSAKLVSGTIFKQHCPMANNGKGGYWLASESTIKNPYYGDDMLGCGSVEEEIK